MIDLKHGNILKSEAEALVNTVNCDGFMGKGIALQFKKAYPKNYDYYFLTCQRKEMQPGKVLVFETGEAFNPKYIVNFPTKQNWKGKSKLEYIKTGLIDLVEQVKSHGITSIAIPPLGCGLGGLNWKDVKPMIESAFQDMTNIQVLIYPPEQTPAAADMPIGTEEPSLTLSRILFLKLMKQYSRFAYRLSLLEIQKMAYFLQEAGQPLKLRFSKGKYGPYAPNLNKVLELLEGHYIHGYGDNQNPDVEIQLILDRVNEINEMDISDDQVEAKLNRVFSLIDGFEIPYGMELIASVHWVAVKEQAKAKNAEEAYKKISFWSTRKAKLFSSEHICIAWDRLKSEGWIK